MINRTDKVLIGKDIARDAQVVGGANIVTISASTGLADGEIVVLDKNKNVLADGSTIADTDTIYICQGLTATFDYTNEAGTAVTGARRLTFSDPIVGSKVRTYRGTAYAAKAEQTASVTLTGMTPVVGTEYLVRIIYKDIKEHPGQFTQTYRYVSTTATLDTFGTAIAAKINAHTGRRVQATYTTGTDVLLLTAKEIPECCSTLDDIDEFSMVDFEVRYVYVNSAGNWVTWPSTSTTVTYTATTYGNGNWEQVRDAEKLAAGYVGNDNKTHFPVLKKDWETVVDETYDLIIIEHENPYLAPNNQGYETARLATNIYIADGASQTANVLAQLNPWMASCPGAFANVSF
jgi:hypothetical protein